MKRRFIVVCGMIIIAGVVVYYSTINRADDADNIGLTFDSIQRAESQNQSIDTVATIEYGRAGTLIDIFDSCTVEIVPHMIVAGRPATIRFHYDPVDEFLDIDNAVVQEIHERAPWYEYETEPIRTLFTFSRNGDLDTAIGHTLQEQLEDVERNCPPKDIIVSGLGERLHYDQKRARAEFTTTFRDLRDGTRDYLLNIRFNRPGIYRMSMSATFADRFRLIRPKMTDRIIVVKER